MFGYEKPVFEFLNRNISVKFCIYQPMNGSLIANSYFQPKNNLSCFTQI